MSKRLVICCDGTWNTPDEVDQGQPVATNVTKLALAVAAANSAGTEQRMFYNKGVGTAPFEHVLGGGLGIGLSQKIKDAYMFIVDNYETDDELFLFGFSRGAYTARSLAGFIRNAGILKQPLAGRLEEAYELYRSRSQATRPRSTEAQLFRKTYSHETRIKFIGVWDTVGALGIPTLPTPAALRSRWVFHDVTLSTWVDNAFHALALDERRKPFEPTLWDQADDAPATQVLEQVWFSGAHSNVGGGYRDAGLSDIALLWLMNKAKGCGLAFDESLVARTGKPSPTGAVRDSMAWFYKPLGDGTRMIPEIRRRKDGNPMRTHESVATTAKKRWDDDPAYRPANLAAYLDRNGPLTNVEVVQGRVDTAPERRSALG
jgi:uncharacterized protein (DUF2235 family)